MHIARCPFVRHLFNRLRGVVQANEADSVAKSYRHADSKKSSKILPL